MRTSDDGRAQSAALTVTALVPVHPHGFGGHEFEYQPGDDVFRCPRCGGYEISLRDRDTGEISRCPGAQTPPRP